MDSKTWVCMLEMCCIDKASQHFLPKEYCLYSTPPLGKKTEPSQKNVRTSQFFINIKMLTNIHGLLSSQMLLVLEFSHFYILVKLLCMILLHP